MSTEAGGHSAFLNIFKQLRLVRGILRITGQALLSLSDRLADELCQALDVLFHCRVRVIFIGRGQVGLVGQRIVASLASTGTHSHFLHPDEAITAISGERSLT